MSFQQPQMYASSTPLKPPQSRSVSKENGDDENDNMMMEVDNDGTTTTTTTTTEVPLVLAPACILPIGCRVMIHGLIRVSKLNGHLGIVEEYLVDQGRYKIRPLSRQAKLLTKSKHVSIRPQHLTKVDDSTFIATITEDTKTTNITSSQEPEKQRLPLQCDVTWSDDPDPQNQQLIVKLLYSSVWKDNRKILSSPSTTENSDCDGIFLDAVNTRIDYDEHVAEDQWLDGHEILILTHKPLYLDLYDSLIEYEIIEELDNKEVFIGLNGTIPLCKLKIRYEGCEGYGYDENENPLTTNTTKEIEMGMATLAMHQEQE